jgi:hypothetical protein
MSDLTSNPLSGVDKFDGSFDQEESGCTIVINQTVNSIKDLAAGGLYMYLLCRPKTWNLNIKHLTTLFNCSKDKIYRLIDVLISLKLLTRTEMRQKGKFLHYHYRIHLRNNFNQIEQVLPFPEKPDTVKPDTEKPDAYKTNILPLEIKEVKTTTTTQTPVSSSFFTKKQKDEFLELKLYSDLRTDEKFIEHCQFHIENQKNDMVKHQRIYGLKSILFALNESGDHFSARGFKEVIQQKTKEEAEEEHLQRVKRMQELNRQEKIRMFGLENVEYKRK